MFSKSMITAVVSLCLAVQVSAHTVLKPALGIKAPVRKDAQLPSAAKPCGKIDIAQNIDTSGSVVAAADGTFTMTATNFNLKTDGSREFITMLMDATGSGKFVPGVTMTKNGDPAPAALGSEQVTGKLPAGTKCTAGKDKNKCIVSLKTKRGFGNCVVVQQGGKAEPAKVAKPATKATKAAKDVKAKDSKRADVARSVDDDKKALVAAMKELLAKIKAQKAQAGDADKTAGAAKDAGERRTFDREY